MQKKDITSLRKYLTKGYMTLDAVYGAYVDGDGSMSDPVMTKAPSMDEPVMNCYLDFVKKVMGTGLGKSVHAMPLSSQSEELLSLINVPDMVKEDGREYLEQLAANIVGTAAYIFLGFLTCSVPSKAADSTTLEDGDGLYRAICCCVCPAKLSASGLMYDGAIREAARRWEIKSPALGFLYPAFTDGMEDCNEVLVLSKKPEEDTFASTMFDLSPASQSVSAEAQKALIGELLGQMDLDTNDLISLTDSLGAAAEQSEDGLVSEAMVRAALADAGINDDGLHERFEATVGKRMVVTDNVLPRNATIDTGMCRIIAPQENLMKIKRTTVDGIDCLIVPADGTVLVNGAGA